MTIPRIAVTFGARPSGPGSDGRDEYYRAAIEQHGGEVVHLGPGDPGAELTGVTGLLLSGGGDIEPRRYGSLDSGRCRDFDAERDAVELRLAKMAISTGLPVLGICRGAQVIGVSLGGQLVQDIGSEVPGAQEHGLGGEGHWVEIAPDSRLAAIIGERRIWVNSSHHQANSKLGDRVVRAAWCDDGVTEGIEVEGAAFAIGVQWHPERMLDSAPSERLFRAFIEACWASLGRREG